jgi:recombination protein RecA
MPRPLSLVLPDEGFPQGAVVELAAPANLGQGVSVALTACAASQEQARSNGGESVWCAFVDPYRTLHGPAVLASGVGLDHLLVVRPQISMLARVALKIASSQIFSVVVIDLAGVPGVAREPAREDWSRIVRRLGLAVENGRSIILVLTDANCHRQLALPVAMRVLLERMDREQLSVHVARERGGRITAPRSVAWTRPKIERSVHMSRLG